MLSFLLSLPIIGSVFLLLINFVKKVSNEFIKFVALLIAILEFILSLLLPFNWNSNSYYSFIKNNFIDSVSINTEFQFAELVKIWQNLSVDGLSIILIILTTFLILICLIISIDTIKNDLILYVISFLVMETLLIGVFSSTSLFAFYIFFEGILIPMYLIIGIWGSRSRKSKAGNYLFFYTFVGSIFMLLGLISIGFDSFGHFDFEYLKLIPFSFEKELFLWILFFIGFGIKIPILPAHIWLPEAHVEAPTAGSVILAGILLKLGGYGFIRFILPIFPTASYFFLPLVYNLAILSILYTSFIALRQIDLKKIIAYSSVAHMNLDILGIFSFNVQGLEGAIFLMLGHGLVASALFLIIGSIYIRHSTRLIRYYGGLTQTMPLFSFCFLFFLIANIGLPGLCNFVGEILIFISIFAKSPFVTFFAAIGVVLCSAYSLWLHNRMNFGTLNTRHISKFNDLVYLEKFIYSIFVVLIILLGVYPQPVLNLIHTNSITVLSTLWII